ncbi:HvfA family oxazolone/thioamide-modified RiPP metallophore [Thiohalobacter sp.]|uniref:HvfA family oxazolone/thioamide-modified RiPP metallophore n=1 Tax=Thiohalobacter sp. TaxID=2025948 RepID=UPI00261D67AC|nr:hypothetical protein [Thiohalobacter sp.]
MKSSISNETLVLTLAGLLATGGAQADTLFSAEPVGPAIQVASADGERGDSCHHNKAGKADADTAEAEKAEKPEAMKSMPEGKCGTEHMKANEGKCGGHH